MKTVKVGLREKSYDILIGYPLDEIGGILKKHTKGIKSLIVTNPTVAGYYLETVERSLQKAGFQVFVAQVPDGEEHKSQAEASKLYAKCLEYRLERESIIVGLGGGVIGDLAGYVAATFMRGLPIVQVPTTLVAQVDSSVGGKVAVNLPEGKNLVGSFYQPFLVYIDLAVLKTLPVEEIEVGMAEVIKYGIILDKKFLEYLEKKIEKLRELDMQVLERVVARCCQLKAGVVKKDEREKGLRAILNFGHTLGHALEALTDYKKYKHGEAVAIGMVGACRIAEKMNMFKKEARDRVEHLIEKAGLPARIGAELSVDSIVQVLSLDKKVRAGRVRFVLPERMGKVVVRNDVPEDIVRDVVTGLME
ncbi:3-dehydroquinate synthase [bacterium]|nr:3-dehydroquinate synthase [bacterium]NIN92021.1 3-dehydroquinate synthase [bacterium]NIO18237.1 3-dehydroquinate synthase [bacterium]NIO73211.1 3-dehydroquinate synthase [bacterium]